jgi:hypothetical protein
VEARPPGDSPAGPPFFWFKFSETQTPLELTESESERMLRQFRSLPVDHPERIALLRQLEIAAAVAGELESLHLAVCVCEGDLSPANRVKGCRSVPPHGQWSRSVALRNSARHRQQTGRRCFQSSTFSRQSTETALTRSVPTRHVTSVSLIGVNSPGSIPLYPAAADAIAGWLRPRNRGIIRTP